MSQGRVCCGDTVPAPRRFLSVAFPHVTCWLSRQWSMNMNSDRGHTLPCLISFLCSLFALAPQIFVCLYFCPFCFLPGEKFPYQSSAQVPLYMGLCPRPHCAPGHTHPSIRVPCVRLVLHMCCKQGTFSLRHKVKES